MASDERTVNISDVVVSDRIRADLGDIDWLCNSIKEYGIIEPVVLSVEVDSKRVLLIAGRRRLSALERLGRTELRHGIEFIWRGEESPLRRKAVELEENLRRKDLTWVEIVTGKQQLLDLMQSIHGAAEIGGRTRAERAAGESQGFGINKLAAMLGESPALTSKDLDVARALAILPDLANAETKESAIRRASIIVAVAQMRQSAKAAPPGEKLWTLYEGDFRDNISKIPGDSVDLVYTDQPFAVGLDKMSKHAGGVVSYSDEKPDMVACLPDVAREAFRILRGDRFAVFFFGFNYYTRLVLHLLQAGFTVNPVPVIWFKHTRSTENPNTRYANAYDPAIVAMKGSPVFIRPGQANVIDMPAVTPSERIQIAQQPVALVEKFIRDMVAPGALVVDLMAGSGTTGVAALQCKCRVILFEREPAACAVIKARLGAL
jgi:DNA modification methylase/ParB-like chromosome segregation protein Spo0J